MGCVPLCRFRAEIKLRNAAECTGTETLPATV
jgi:hypothetical protein